MYRGSVSSNDGMNSIGLTFLLLASRNSGQDIYCNELFKVMEGSKELEGTGDLTVERRDPQSFLKRVTSLFIRL